VENITYFGYTKEEIIMLYLKSKNREKKEVKTSNVIDNYSVVNEIKDKYLKRKRIK